MNFLNPFALIGLAAASIPVLLHLLNMRRLRTVEFSTLRFLLQLQQTRVRRLKLQQLLLLILRTLLVLFAVLALARPTIPGRLPLLSSPSRSSVVILVDNSYSMEASDAAGQRLRQAISAATSIVDGLQDGDEVAVIPMVGADVNDRIAFTRTFDVAREDLARIRLSEGTAELPPLLRSAQNLFADALHAHHEVYVISDAQRSLTMREYADSSLAFESDASIFLVRIGNGLRGLEQNLSVDSIHIVTKLLQSDKPIEVEASVRNGSEQDATGVVVSLAIDGTRVAQRVADLPANSTRTVLLAAPPQKTGIATVSVELDNDAIDLDNSRWAGVLIPERAKVAIVGAATETTFIRTVLSLPGMERSAPLVRTFASITEASSSLPETDVLVISGGALSVTDIGRVRLFAERGGGLLVFSSQSEGLESLLAACGLTVGSLTEAPRDAPFQVTSTDRDHPLFAGVFKPDADRTRSVESPKIWKLRPASGGVDIVQTGGGPLVTEAAVGRGRVLYAAVSPLTEWSTYPLTGLFAAFVIRSVLYCAALRDDLAQARVGEPLRLALPPRYAGLAAVLVTDVQGVTSRTACVQLPSGAMVDIPPQDRSGVVRIQTEDSRPVMAVAVNGSNLESHLSYFERGDWKSQTNPMVKVPDHVVEVEAGRSMREVVTSARTGSELWPLFIVLALSCAAAEMLVSRFMATDAAPLPS